MSETKGLVLYIARYAHYILVHGYLYDRESKPVSMGYSNWKSGATGYIKAAANMAVPVTKYIDAIYKPPRDNSKLLKFLEDTLIDKVGTVDRLTVLTTDIECSNIKGVTALPIEIIDPGVERLKILRIYCRDIKDVYHHESSPKNYWTTKDTAPTILLSGKMLIHSNRLGTNNDTIYHMVNTGPTEDIGKKRSALSYMVVQMKTPVKAIDDILHKRERYKSFNTATSVIHMDEVFKPYNVSLSNLFEKSPFRVARKQPMVITAMNGSVLLEDIYPASLASRAIADFKTIRKTLAAFNNKKDNRYRNYFFEDITDTFIDKNGKLFKKYDKTKLVSIATTHASGVKIPLVLGEDLPTRNILVRLAKTNLSIYTYLHIIGNICYYGIIIENDEGVCVYVNFYSNTTFTTEKRN